MNLKSLVLGSLLFFPMLTQAATENARQDAFMHELEAARYALTIKYAPTEWKSEYLKWSAEEAYEEAISKMIETNHLTTRDYQRIYRGFLGSLQDYHVSTHFYSTEWSAFPIQVKSVNGRYYITDFQFSLALSYSDLVFDFDDFDIDTIVSELSKCQTGDELLAINGVPVKNIIENLIDQELSGNRTPTGYALAEKMLFTRYGKRGHHIPKGEFTITVQPANSRKTMNCNLAWLHVPEWVKDPQPKAINEESLNFWHRMEKYFVKDYKVGLAYDLLNTPLKQIIASEEEDDEDNDWREKSFVPPLGNILWESNSESGFYAYLYLNDVGEKIGYFYIPDFAQGGQGADLMISELKEIINRFEAESDALVIDLNDNPGGNLFYMYGILSLLTDKPLIVPTQTETLIQEDVYSMASIYNSLKQMLEDEENEDEELSGGLSGYPIDENTIRQIMDYSRSILDQWESGNTRTTPAAVFGIDRIMPHPEARYTKPIMVLINELDFSCGDFFPAILQDNSRATLFGKQTAGAGGYVRGYGQTSQFGVMAYSLTGSLAYRVDGKVIENLGVSPDVPYQMTERDLRSGYVDYIRTVNRQVHQLIK
jgi:hypothetical protein